MNNEQWDYKIDGKLNGITRVVIPLVLSAVFTIIAVDQLKSQPNKSLFVAAACGIIAFTSLYLLFKLSVRYFCFKVYIGGNGFYFQSNPFNGKYYEYDDLVYGKEELKTRRSRQSTDVLYYYFFVFKDKNGKATRFQFEKSVCEREINALKKRINRIK
ncbi:MAG TPA: hypothetical protein VFD52_06640 [Clostridia bacterium]|nr:hypothetical protein [Clostridia bacterium]